MSESLQYIPGNLVRARNRLWVVQPDSSKDWLNLRPMGGADSDIVSLIPDLEAEGSIGPAEFSYPDPEDIGVFSSGRFLYDALRFQLRSGTGPFRSFGSLNLIPRSYQYVPLLMAMRQQTVRLLIADDVGVGKTIEAGMIARELIDRGEISTLAVLCPPHLVEQWVEELKVHFNINALAVTSSSASSIEKRIPIGQTMLSVNSFLVVSLDYIKTERHRYYFQSMNLDMLIVDEAHTCVKAGDSKKQQRFEFIRDMLQEERAGLAHAKHLLLLTATPHSGNQDAYYNLLSLLDPKFLRLKDELGRKERESLRQELAKYFVQRRRKDIESWSVANNDTTNFTVRQTADLTYKLDDEWQRFFDEVRDYCQRIYREHEDGNKLIAYAVIALFRCISSSPKSAVSALTNRLKTVQEHKSGKLEDAANPAAARAALSELLDEVGDQDENTIADRVGMVSSEVEEDSDSQLPRWEDQVLQEQVSKEMQQSEEEQLEELRAHAEKLFGVKNDPKLKKLVTHIKSLLKDGFMPVIFCRYIKTAEYVAENLKAELKKGVTVECVTGEISSEERKAMVEQLGESDSRVLVATDCLSEGINLQNYFTAVVHYDLAWNPTRHEQREGRVDRFGQKAPEVRCSLLYGNNNPMDEAVINVIQKKSELIRDALGVTVPVPDSEIVFRDAFLAAIFKKNHSAKQSDFLGQLDADIFSEDEEADIEAAVDIAWQNAADKVKGIATVFAQRSIHIDDVRPIWQKEQAALGSLDELKYFVREASAFLGAPIEEAGGLSSAATLNTNAITNAKVKLLLEGEDLKQGQQIDLNMLNRVSPIVNILSEYVINSADKSSPDAIAAATTTGVNKLSRVAIADSPLVQSLTRIFLIRLRYQMRITYNNQLQRHMMVEEVLPVAVEGAKGTTWLETKEAEDLLFNAKPQGVFSPMVAQRLTKAAIEWIKAEETQKQLQEFANKRALEIKAEHESVKQFTAHGSVSEVKPCLPFDIMGCYILRPVDEE